MKKVDFGKYVFDQKWLPKWMKSDNVGGEIVQILIGFSIHIER